MKTMLAAGVMAVLAVPAFAEEEAAAAPRLDTLETLVITAEKEAPAASTSSAARERLEELEIVESTAPKQQPAGHEVDDKTAALLAELAQEE